MRSLVFLLAIMSCSVCYGQCSGAACDVAQVRVTRSVLVNRPRVVRRVVRERVVRRAVFRPFARLRGCRGCR